MQNDLAEAAKKNQNKREACMLETRSSSQCKWFKVEHAVTQLERTTSKSQGRTPLLIEGLQLRLQVAYLCQSTRLFRIVWVLLSQTLAA